ncbi:MAG: membrane dipeptidase [Anaerolineae bacterium]|nr:membrane dipeptidase [Roseiflexus sp.]MCS7287746.1 membrane dipeptidase [Roseiflexus sp.]MDW8055017.1 membrane dipeptidase [Anaerolineae bacterium]MDW8147561.1 membrane dipeptidase [Roseiflexaceae bacterium]MDW8233167.1 membrane dipeptidase [Roseiflexaceae bacterium]
MILTLPIFDGHNDTLFSLYTAEHDDTFFASANGHLDLVSAQAGGFAGGFFAIFPTSPDVLPDDGRLPDPLPHPHALQTGLGATALLFRIKSNPPGRYALCAPSATLSAASEPMP